MIFSWKSSRSSANLASLSGVRLQELSSDVTPLVWYGRTAHADHPQNQLLKLQYVGTTEAAQKKDGTLSPLCVFPSASLTQKMLFAFVSSILFTLFFLAFTTIFTVKERWMLPNWDYLPVRFIGFITKFIALSVQQFRALTAWTA